MWQSLCIAVQQHDILGVCMAIFFQAVGEFAHLLRDHLSRLWRVYSHFLLDAAQLFEAQFVPGEKYLGKLFLFARIGEVVPRDVREMYDRGLQYLATTQSENGDWSGGGGEQGPGVTGMGLMVFLASGEDPNFGLYSNHVRKACRNIITQQNASTGILGSSMYHHGFGMLGLA